MRGADLRPIVIAAGGTGGHLFPAEALAATLLARGERVVVMTDARSAAFTAFAGTERHVLSGSGIAGRGALGAARSALRLGAGVLEARRLLDRLRASAVVGFGGYPSVPPVVAALTLRDRPAIVLHEQNAVLGRANRWLAPRADRLALSFAATSHVPTAARTEIVGNPVRPAIAALMGAPDPGMDGALRLLVLGGSLGARVFSDIVPDAVAALPPELRSRLIVTQQCRAEDLPRVAAAYDAAGVPAELAPFFADIAGRLALAHVVIARAGASTVAELACAGRPAILVPLPNAIDDHQTANARALADAGGAVLLPQPGLTAPALSAHLARLLATPSPAARTLARPRASETLADLVLGRVAARNPV